MYKSIVFCLLFTVLNICSQKDSYKIVIVVGLARPSTVNYLISRFGAKASIHSSRSYTRFANFHIAPKSVDISRIEHHLNNSLGFPDSCKMVLKCR